MLELHQYDPALLAFLRASDRDPELRFDFAVADGATVVDAGAYVGEWATGMAARHRCRIECFEINPRVIPALDAAVRGWGSVVVHAHGLGATDGTAQLTAQGPGSTTFGDVPVLEVEVRDVAAVLDELQVDRIAVMKLNIEGGEYEVLGRLVESGWLNRIDALLIQFHEWIPGSHRARRRIRRALRTTHGETWCFPWVFERWDAISSDRAAERSP